MMCQFLLDTVQLKVVDADEKFAYMCQFLLGTVQLFQNYRDSILSNLQVSIPLRYGTTCQNSEFTTLLETLQGVNSS